MNDSNGPTHVMNQSIGRHNSFSMKNRGASNGVDNNSGTQKLNYSVQIIYNLPIHLTFYLGFSTGYLSGGEFSLMAMARGRERFIEILTSWERSKVKKIERAEKDEQRDKLTAEDLKKSLPDHENEIGGDMIMPRGDDENQFGSIYFQETCHGKFPLRNKILRMELK